MAKSDSGLPKASVINVSQLLTLDRSVLTKKVRQLPATVMRRLNDGLQLVLGL